MGVLVSLMVEEQVVELEDQVSLQDCQVEVEDLRLLLALEGMEDLLPYLELPILWKQQQNKKLQQLPPQHLPLQPPQQLQQPPQQQPPQQQPLLQLQQQ